LGGSLTPIGDPPLFLGFLKGIPFLWVLEHIWAVWVIAMLYLLSHNDLCAICARGY
jgi:Na+/H+ antiporter NhaD/arsenite permease-like protein